MMRLILCAGVFAIGYYVGRMSNRGTPGYEDLAAGELQDRDDT